MSEVSIRELRNHGGDVVDRVAAGERIVVTRAGRPVAELLPIRATTLAGPVLLARWRRLPTIDLEAFRRDIDRGLEPGL